MGHSRTWQLAEHGRSGAGGGEKESRNLPPRCSGSTMHPDHLGRGAGTPGCLHQQVQQGLRICIGNKFPNVADAAVPL